MTTRQMNVATIIKHAATKRHSTEEVSTAMQLKNEHLQFLLRIALLGIQTGHFDSARRILDALDELTDRDPLVRVMNAYAHCKALDTFDGRHQLLELLDEQPGLHLAKAILALEDKDHGVAGWQQLAEEVLLETTDPASTGIADFVLQEK